MNSYKLRLVEGIFLVLIVLLSHIFLGIPNALLNTTGSSTLINIIYVGIITIVFFYIIYKLFSLFPGNSIIDICEFLGGKVLKFIYCIFFIAYILLLSALMIKLFSEGISLIYLSHININIIILFIIIFVGILNLLGFKSISRLSILIVPTMILSIIFLFFASLENFTYERIFPVWGYGIKETFVDGLSNIFSFDGIYILFFIFPFLTKISDFKKIGLWSIIFYGIFLLFSVSALLFSIPQISDSSTLLSLYYLARQISLGNYLQSIDALFLFIWIPFFILYISINMHFSLSTFQKITSIKHPSGMIYSFCAILFVLTLILSNVTELRVLSNLFYKYVSIIFIFGFNLIILVLAAIKRLIQIRRRRKTCNV